MPKLGRALQTRRLHFDKLLGQFVCVLERTSTAPPAVRVHVHVHVRENWYSEFSDSCGWPYCGESRVFSGHQQTQPACSVGCAVGVRQASDGDVDEQRKTGSQIGFL